MENWALSTKNAQFVSVDLIMEKNLVILEFVIFVVHLHTLLPAIETTDAIGNTENKQVKRNMSKYFQRMFMLISLSLGYLFKDTYSYFL